MLPFRLPPPCSFPRGCGGLLEWRNAFLLFVNLPEAGERASPSRRYSNQFLWLPAAATSGQGGAAGAGNEEQQGDQQQEQPNDDEEQRLCMTWWRGRGQSLQHPVIQRLLAAGAAGDSQPAAAAAGAAAGEEATGAGDSGQKGEQLQAQQQQTAVLLFCRAGSSPFVFCGRLRPAGVGSPPEPVAAASAGLAGLAWGSSGIQQAAWQQAAEGSTAVASDSGTDGGGSCCITWELTDAGSLLDVGDTPGGTAFQQMLRP